VVLLLQPPYTIWCLWIQVSDMVTSTNIMQPLQGCTSPGRLNFVRWRYIFVGLCVEFVSHHPGCTWNFEMTHRLLENLWSSESVEFISTFCWVEVLHVCSHRNLFQALQWYWGLNSYCYPRWRCFKFIVPLNAFMTVQCTQASRM